MHPAGTDECLRSGDHRAAPGDPSVQKSKEDTWKSEELKRHMKAGTPDRQHEDKKNRDRRYRRDEVGDERIERRHRKNEKDRKEEREQRKSSESDRNQDEEMEVLGDQHREKDKGKERDKVRDRERDCEPEREKYYTSEKDKTREREKVRDRKHSWAEPDKLSGIPKAYGGTDLVKEEKAPKRREIRESLGKTKHQTDDRERRHLERKEKEGKKRANEDYGERDSRHRKPGLDVDMQDSDRERKRGERKEHGNAEREKRHRNRQENETQGARSLRSSKKDAPELIHTVKEKSHRNAQEEGREKTHREKSNRIIQPSEIRKINEEVDKSDTGAAYNADAADDSTNYEEDFEDYDDDFEEDSDVESKEPVKKQGGITVCKNAEMEEIQRAIILENEKIASFPSIQRQKRFDQELKQEQQDSPNKGPHRGVFIDFGSAKQQLIGRHVASKQKKRSAEILRLIDLDFSLTFSLLDLAPVKEYEMYIRNFGKTNTKQAYIQCNEDCVDREVQTEEIDIEEKWTQHPGESAVVCGGHKNDTSVNVVPIAKVDSQRLTSFLRSACQVIAVLLEEDRAEKQSDWKLQSEESCMSISDGCFQLNTNLPFLHDRNIYSLHFSQVQRHILLTVHGLCNNSGAVRLDNKYIICVWNIWEPSTPQKVLICESEVKCCCFSPGKAALVFAGTVDGSVLVWDLREDSSMHHTMSISHTNWTFRSATFSTDGVFTKINHTGVIMAIEPVSSVVYKDHAISTLSSPEEKSGLSFQIASLDESGHLILWVVVELRKVDLAGSQSDLGLIPGGKVKLVHSSAIHLNGDFFSKDVISFGIPETLNIKFLPQDSNHFVIGTDIGLVSHGTRYGLIVPPKQYKPLQSKTRPVKVTAIDFSPFGVPAFLAGCSDGCIRLHMITAECPVMQWNDSTNGHSITSLQWSLTRPTVFFVLDATCCIYIWDLLQNDLQPVAKESVLSDQVLSMAVLGEPEKNNGLMGLALAKISGKVEIQYIKKMWAKSQPKEMEKLRMILQEIL
ncbi:cytoplasmic dynein 2 intermediate chain 1 isoform X3 [Ascaphus truei]|uniref:cytoplasmic dynein 2 intermediate chain 1 isoform X3 n=1 Tax=Ascaphus truei TaxID=8439 RepID=UPI003F59DFAF